MRRCTRTSSARARVSVSVGAHGLCAAGRFFICKMVRGSLAEDRVGVERR